MSVNLMLNGVVKEGFTGDIVTASQKNMNNWTVDGDVTITFSDGENTVDYENGGGSYVGPDGNTYKYYLYMQNTYAGNGPYSFWCNYPFVASKEQLIGERYRLITGITYDGVQDKFGIGSLGTKRGTKNFDFTYVAGDYVTGKPAKSSLIGYYGNEQNFPYEWSINLTAQEIANFNIPLFDTNAEALAYVQQSIISFDGYAELSLSVTDTKQYILTFEACSTTGFNAETDQIIVTSGANVVTETFNNTQTETLKKYIIMFIADGNIATVKFDFSKMVNSSDIELIISDVSLFELG